MSKLKFKERKLKINIYSIVAEAVERGIQFGVNRAYKHTITSLPAGVAESIYKKVMLALAEVIDFD